MAPFSLLASVSSSVEQTGNENIPRALCFMRCAHKAPSGVAIPAADSGKTVHPLWLGVPVS